MKNQRVLKKRIVAAALSAMLVVTAFGCSKSDSMFKLGKYAWICTNIPENQQLVANIRLQDDFAAAANAQWLADTQYDPISKNGTFEDAKRIMDDNMRAMLDDESINDKNLELLRTFDGLYSDWDYRDEIGTEPLKKYLKYIDRIKSVDDAKAYMLDNEKNPYAVMLVSLEPYLRDDERSHYSLCIKQPAYSLGEPDYYSDLNEKGLQKLEGVKELVSYTLKEAGYSGGDIKEIMNDCFAFESRLVALSPYGNNAVYSNPVMTKDEVIEEAGSYPIEDMMKHYQMEGVEVFSVDSLYLRGVGEILDKADIDEIKAYFKVILVLKSKQFLTKDIFELSEKVGVDKTNPFGEVQQVRPDRYLFYTITNGPLKSAMDQAYLDYHYDEATAEDIRSLCEMYVEAYKEIIDEKDWLSDENKAIIKEKLEAMDFKIMKPDNEADYSSVTLIPKEEGGSLLDAYAQLSKFQIMSYAEITTRDFDRTFWDIYEPNVTTTSVGASYHNACNVIYINIAIVGGDFYRKDMKLEEKLGLFGTVIGHEISHAFDSGGVYKDKNGEPNPIILGNDMNVFTEKAKKVTEYYAGIRPFEGGDVYKSNNPLSKESIADMGGVKAGLVIAKNMPDDAFDYDLFFRSYASLWKSLSTKSLLISNQREGVHPHKYLRINVTVQQFDEFYETYNVNPGDNMYLAPEDRIAIW